jgi:hypothetical protein
MWKIYYGTKRILAHPETKKDAIVPAGPTNIITEPKEGYAVQYEDGYTSWSPKEVFEAAYRPSGKLNFGHALQAMREGYTITRERWKGVVENMYVFYEPSDNLTEDPFGGKLYRRINGGKKDLWQPNQYDLLAEDYMISSQVVEKWGKPAGKYE